MFEIEKVVDALNTMYSGASQEQKKLATSYLEEFQKSNEAWEIAHKYLGNDDQQIHNQIQIKLFLSQTLRNKLTYDLNQISNDNYNALKSLLLDLVVKYNEKSFKLIRVQLYICLSQLIIQDLEWADPLNDLINYFTSHNLTSDLFEFLKILPEELNDINKTYLTNEEFNDRVGVIINNKNLEMVFSLFIKYLSGNELIVLDCLNNWIKELSVEQFLSLNDLTNLIFNSINNELLFEPAIECLISIVRETKDIDNLTIINGLLIKLIELNDMINVNEDNFEQLAKLYIEACESWHVLIAKHSQEFYKLVEIVMHYCEMDVNLNIIQYSFYFWYMLKQLIVLPNFKNSRAILSPIYEKLITIIINHLTYPIEEDGDDDDLFQGDKEQEDKFKDFRYEMGDVLKDCTVVIGPIKALSIPFERIKVLLSDNRNWQFLEAALFSLRSMAKEIPKTENEMLPAIMNYLIQLPEHPKIRYSTILVLGRYTEWTNKNPQYLEVQLNYIMKGLQINLNQKDEKNIMIATTRSLMYFCQDCSELLINYLDQLYLLYQELHSKVDIESNLELIDGISHILGKLPENDQRLYEYSLTFLTPIFNQLGQANGDEKKIGDLFDIFSAFVKVLKVRDYNNYDNKVVQIYVENILPLIIKFLKENITNLFVNEKILKLLKTSIQSFNIYLLPNISDIVNLLIEGFKINHFGCYLFVSGAIIKEFSDDQEFEPEIINSVFQFGVEQAKNFFTVLSSTNDFNEISDVIEDFFRMLDDLLMYFPNQYFDANDELLLIPSVESSIILLDSLDAFDSIIAIIHYLIDFISWGFSTAPISFYEVKDHNMIRNKVKQIINDNGEKLLKQLIYNLIFKFTDFKNDTIIYDINDTILKLINLSDNQLVVTWLFNIVSSLPNSDQRQVEKFYSNIQVAIENKDKKQIRSSLNDFVNWYTRKNVKVRSIV